MLTDPNQRATTVKNQAIIEIREKKLKTIKFFMEPKKVTPISLSQTTTPTIIATTTTKTVTELKESQKLSIHAVRYVAKRTTPQRDVMFEPTQPTGHLPGRANLNNRTHRTV